MTKITLEPLEHRGSLQIAVKFAFNSEIKHHIKKLEDIKWSQTHRTFYLPLNAQNKKLIFQHIRKKGWTVDYTKMQGVSQPKKLPTKKAYSREEKNILHEYVDYLRGQRLGESTVKTYYNFVLKFIDFNTKSFEDINTRDVQIFVEQVVAKQNYSISSHRQCISALKHFGALFYNSEFDVDLLKRPKKSQFLPTVLSKEEVLRLLQNTRNLKHRAILALIYSAGLRVGELLNLKVDDIDIERNYIHVRQAKGRKDRYALLAESFLPLLHNYLHTFVPTTYFVEGENGKKYSYSSVRAFLNASCKRAGIRKKVTPHTLRHSFATHILENGIGLRHIQELLGHSKPETTMIYTHVAQKDLIQIQSPLDATIKEMMHKRKDEQNIRLSGEY